MPRTKKLGARSHQPSPLHGADTNSDQVRHLELMVKELECTLESTFATTQANARRICRNVDMWYDNIIRTVPKEVLNRPYKEVWDSISPSPTPDMSVATALLPSSAGSSVVASASADGEASTSKQPQKKPTTARKARQGETLVPLTGSPVSGEPPEVPVQVHIDKGQPHLLA
ncbi:uncharacterized protein [Dermacentor albipictus]|uniref:uncharacterized protein isoform X2 n=1 Tax=Dermacentor albipictus TaxID=60249 RepID=UPI0031FD77F4